MSKVYTHGQIVKFIEKVFGASKSFNNGLNHAVVCPICKHYKGQHYSNKKLNIKTVTPNIMHCWVCNYSSSNMVGLLKKFFPDHVGEYKERFLDSESLREDKDLQEKSDQIITFPSQYVFLPRANKTKYISKCYEYLSNRGIGEKEIWQYKLGITGYENKDLSNRIIIPSFDSDGVINFWTSRSMNPKVSPSVKYVNCQARREKMIFNEYFIDWKTPLVITEGPFDLFKTAGNATALLGSSISSQFKLFHKILHNRTPLILAFDNDAGKKMLATAKMFSEFNVPVKIFSVPKKYKDIGEMSYNEFSERLENSVDYDDDFVLKFKIESL